MARRLGLVTIVVRDYDAALDFYVGALGFELAEDTDLGDGKRWLVVSPGEGGARLLLAKADGPAQAARIGDQTGGRVGFFLMTDDFMTDHAAMVARGVKFHEAPRHESYGIVAVFEDIAGNLWDMIERR